MSFWFFISAGLITALWMLVHLTLGERDVARPILNDAVLDDVVRETQYLCWHFATVSMACMSAFFVAAAILGNDTFAIAAVALAVGFALSGIGLVAVRNADPLKVPQGWLFIPVAGLGALGLVT